ncbi:hypothetical protein AN639_12200 [Candidatus Epulonipiscium fishelsonii]|uniref:Uncharacterized protein n=1 Tax=Candidatus Epulonipiscium fishelsonii TaxID=77094 RepID=A0ACC8XFJ6_9FIRM|nr:hypothetical protein AN396_02370 [Epulopiscium sp. SCG-B11WGA-EpuloA1]ONI42526.1 hypothetical protein AN639_12200 [Epulopiscium sp. SCG-B05WGA-EpuloA1]
MHKKLARPISRILMLGSIIMSIGGSIYIPTTSISGILIIVLGGVVTSVTFIIKPIGDLYNTYRPRVSELNRYASFAELYLKDRQLKNTRADFEKALRNDWHDVVTAYILLSYLNDKEEFAKAVTISMRYESIKSLTVLINTGKKMDSGPAQFLFKEALFKESLVYMELLYKLDIDIDFRDSVGDTFLIIASRNNLEEQVDFLLDKGASWNIKNTDGDTALFIALANQHMNIYKKLLAKAEQIRSEKYFIEKRTFSERIILEKKRVALNPVELINRIIPGAKDSMIPVLADYLNNRESYSLDIKNKYELYVRKSNIIVDMITATDSTKNALVTISKDRYTSDLIENIQKKYSFCMDGQFYVDSIYDSPKCIESERVMCLECNGTSQLLCSECKGEGYIPCSVCGGDGSTTCPDCKGTGELSCEQVQPYEECRSCKKAEYTCINCTNGEQVCPTCEGHGTKRCVCPPGKQVKCTKCTNGTIIEFDGTKKRCSYCDGGMICTLCNGTKWVLSHYVDQGYACKTCKGKKTSICKICKGKKKLKCKRLFKKACSCKDGQIPCKACGSKGKKLCPKCLGEKMKPCRSCDKGYKFSNTYADFKAYNIIQSEAIISNEQMPVLIDLLPSMAEKILTQHPYLTAVYTGIKVEFSKDDIYLSPDNFKQKIMSILEDKNPDSIVDILEVAPIEYQEIKFYKEGKEALSCIMINDTFYR